jgi:hypothetical protein
MTLSGIRKISVELAATGLSAGANTVATFPAQSVILAAGVEVTEALAGASALTFDIGTGADDDEFVAAYAMAGKSAGDVAPSIPGIAYAEDTLDLTIDTLTGTATAGKLRVWALVMDVDGKGADEVARDYLA